MKIKKGDYVRVITGKHKGVSGQIIKINHVKQFVFLEEITMKKHQKPKQDDKSGKIIILPKPIHVSNVMALDSKKKDTTRLGYRFEKGEKVRFEKKTLKTI